eukprot:GHVP01054892.1.p1 GENE.GHVP01054892.1~~GHVP01054892.1.p1  ORF type:complete len:125 (+),score=15.47 GHVP01054892.1:158-532(+)
MKPSAKDDYFCKKSILKNYDKENKTQDFFGDYHYDQNGRDWNVTCIIGSQQSPVLIRQNPVSWHLSRLSVSDFSPMWRTGDNLITQCNESFFTWIILDPRRIRNVPPRVQNNNERTRSFGMVVF